MFRRRTQSAAYWQEEYTVTEQDLEYLYGLFLEDERPRTTQELALEVIRYRCQQEEALIQRELAKGTLFQPKLSYAVGEQVVFPMLDYAVGTVVSVREGHNPAYEPFKVIRVRFPERGEEREFAAEFPHPHPLNLEEGQKIVSEDLASPEEIYTWYGKSVERQLQQRLAESPDFVRFGEQWFLQGLLAEIHVGHLNIAEAMLDISAKPLPPEEILPELDLPPDMSQEVQIFSLNYALSQDGRFDDVGAGDQVLWYLYRLEPPEVVHPPRRLLYTPIPYDRSWLNEELLQLEREIDDEFSEWIAAPPPPDTAGVTITLTYPHRRVGTLPLTSRTRFLFPAGGNHQRTRITLIDGRTGEPMEGWVVYEHRYVFGLEQWYEENKIPSGAFIKLERAADPLTVIVDYLPRRLKREWVRVARVVDGQLLFEMRRKAIRCEYDELMIIGEDDTASVDTLWIETEEAQRSLYEILLEVFPELAKLSPQGTVHAKTLYNAVNVVRRCPPGPIFAEMASRPCFIPVGGGYWAYNEELC